VFESHAARRVQEPPTSYLLACAPTSPRVAESLSDNLLESSHDNRRCIESSIKVKTFIFLGHRDRDRPYRFAPKVDRKLGRYRQLASSHFHVQLLATKTHTPLIMLRRIVGDFSGRHTDQAGPSTILDVSGGDIVSGLETAISWGPGRCLEH